MIYVTGDTHGEQLRFTEQYLPQESAMTDRDYLIVCGDFGYLFLNDSLENIFLNRLEQKPYTVCFCDGNHENFPAIYSYPREIWNGGRIHRIRRNVIHLMRGQVFTIDGKRIFTMGGAYSRDRHMRRSGLSYWSQELPCESEYREAEASLREVGYDVDYIITHTAPYGLIKDVMRKHPDPNDEYLTKFFDIIVKTVRFKRWFFGHWHEDREYGERFRALRYDVVRIDGSAPEAAGKELL